MTFQSSSLNSVVVLWPEERPCERAWLLQNIKGVAGVLANEELLDAAGPSLRVVSTMSVGYGVYRNISISRSWPNGTSESVTFCGPQLSTTASSPTRTVGFLGFGRISQATLAGLASHKLKALEHEDFDRLARESDVLFVLALGEKTHHLVDATFLRKMKPMSVLANAGRRSVVDSDALATALREKWIWDVGLDVMEDEPAISKFHPLVKEPRCVMVPHIGSATLQTRLDMATCAIDNLVGGLFGGEMQ
ncbi:D-isomer specific 2-hydroxyacid dehydrogenase [Mycena leptocephala]|nr:D-isomer specific 2-hydroxyacid dehydrogenase [Mycena leptocephala]